MIDSILIAPYGMNCALCSAYLALKNDLKGKGVKMTYCAGCRPRNKMCAFLKKPCSKLSNGKISFCFECGTFPCRRLKTIDKRYRSRYRMSMIENLQFIREHRMKKFLEAQEKAWKCPKCGESICCHNGLCFNCDIEMLRNKKKKYRWNEE